MLTVKTNFSQEQVDELEKLFQFETYSDRVPEIKETLHDLSLVYIRSELIEGQSQEARDEYAFHFYLINSILNDILKIESLAPKTEG